MEKKNAIFFIVFIVLCLYLLMPFGESYSKLNIVGSTSVQPLCEELVEEYKKKHGGVDINVQGGGSSLGIKCAENSLADIGMSSKEVNQTNLKEYEIGVEGIAVVVNPDNPISDLSSNQIKSIFSGNISSWSEISNRSGMINVVVREEGSGTLDAFKDSIMNGTEIRDDAIIQNSAGAVKQAVINDKNAIGFVSLVNLDNNLKDIKVDGIEISEKSIRNGSYELKRPFTFMTDKTPSKDAMDFINWSLSSESSEIFEKEKIIKID